VDALPDASSFPDACILSTINATPDFIASTHIATNDSWKFFSSSSYCLHRSSTARIAVDYLHA
jgi:hypothetical protein